MNDWRSKVEISRGDGYKAAAAVLGLLFLLIFAGWILSRFARHDPPPPLQTPTPPAVPPLTPR
jgi:hypothetical protein